MVLKDLSHLSAGRPPDDEPTFARALVDRWAEEVLALGKKPTALNTTLRHSDAGACGRKLYYQMTGVESSDDFDLPFFWVTGLGTRIHQWWQEAIEAMYPAASEVKCQIEGLDASGHIDTVVTLPDKTVCLELKSINGFGYKKAVGDRGKAPDGPRFSAIVQGALNAKAIDADELVIVYLAMESISKGVADKNGISEVGRIAAQWTYTKDEYMPLADAEQARWQALLDGVAAGKVPARKIPDPEIPKGAIITNPATGYYEVKDQDGQVLSMGTTWVCGYCSYQSHCVTQP